MPKRIFTPILRGMVTLCVLGASAFSVASETVSAEPKVLYEWNFDTPGNLDGWKVGGGMKDVTVENGVLKGTYTGNDPILFLPEGEFIAKPGVVMEVRMKTDFPTRGELYFTNTHEGPYGGFSGEKMKLWKIHGNGEFHTYRFMPGWVKEGKVIKLRLDPGSPTGDLWGKSHFEIDYARILDLNYDVLPYSDGRWHFNEKETRSASNCVEIGPVRLKNSEYLCWCTVEMAVTKGIAGKLRIHNDSMKDPADIPFAIRADGKIHTYNILAFVKDFDPGKPFFLTLEASDAPEATVFLKSISFSDNPQGSAQLEVQDGGGLTDALCRAGRPLTFEFQVTNTGGNTLKNLLLGNIQLPDGVKILECDFPRMNHKAKTKKQNGLTLEPFDTATCKMMIQSEKALTDTAKVELIYDNGVKMVMETVEFPLEIGLPALNLPRAEYVPEPKPVKSKFEIGALYFPGWGSPSAWERIFPVAPIRKPILGWYDEANPECIDWQIKWAVENGIQYFLVDWYWNRGSQHLDHWVNGFKKAKYRSYLKWAMMWANHNGPGSHSEEDQAAVTKFWIENYFNMPEYYRINDKPVVMIWSPEGMDNDVREIYRQKGNNLKRGEGVKKLLDLSQKMAQEAGYKGIYFIAMKWPEASASANDIQWLADAGFEMTSIYHYMHHGNKAPNPQFFSFDYCVESSRPYWEARQKTGILPFLPNLSTGWDSRPWHGMKQTVIYDRTPDKFRKICEECRDFAEENGIRNVILAPLNEWGEGSYAEPNKEFGFGMYEAVRDTFCEKPESGWSMNYAPADVGLGPYDFNFQKADRKLELNSNFLPEETLYENGKDSGRHQVWRAFMGVTEPKCVDGNLIFETQTLDPAIHAKFGNLQANRCGTVKVRMKITLPEGEIVGKDHVQLFWSSPILPMSESTSCSMPVILDGEYHEYIFPVSDVRTWKGKIETLRLDPCNQKGARVEIDRIWLEE